jgi:hypothetical protein
MHKGKKHEEMSVMDAYNDFARSEGPEAKKYVDSIRKNNPLAKGVDDMMDEESRRRESGYYVKGTVMSKDKTVDTKDDGMSRIGRFKLPHQGMSRMSSPLNKGRCWDGYKPNPDGRPKSEPGSCVKE